MRKFLIVLLSIFSLSGCADFESGSWGDWNGEIISRVQSLDQKVDALVIEGSQGATSGFSSRVFVVNSGIEFDNKSAIFDKERAILIADGVEGLQLTWKASKTLEISFKSARIFHYSNFIDVGPEHATTRYDVKLLELSK